MPLISEAVKWRSVSLISEAVRRGNFVSDFIGSEGKGKGGRESLISETPSPSTSLPLKSEASGVSVFRDMSQIS